MRQGNQHFKRRKSDNLIFGRQPVLELLQTDKTVDKILLQNSASADVWADIKKLAAQKNVPLKYVPIEKLNAVTGGIHQGIIAFTSAVDFMQVEDVVPHIIEQGKIPLLIILDGITDVRNFGAIARTAYAAGADAIVIPFTDAAPVNAEAVKASAGALTKISVCREKNYAHTFEYLKLNGIHIIGTDGHAEKYCHQIDFTVPVAIILGSEDEGMSGMVRKYVDINIKLPMQQNRFDSYNVSVAAGMVLYEVMRQRG